MTVMEETIKHSGNGVRCRRGERSTPAAAVINKITWCLVHAGEIIVAGTKHKHLHDVEEEGAKAAQGRED